MKYVRNMDDLKRYTFEFFDTFLPQEISDKMVNYFLKDIGQNSLFDVAVKYFKSTPLNLNTIAEFGEVIMQTNNYKDYLKKYMELLLKAECFEGICLFLNRLFLQQIGDAKYKSIRKDYNIKERYFDRFVEITKYCELDKNLYLPFFIAIFNSEAKSRMFDYKEPLKEYLDIFLKEGEDDEFISKLLSSDSKNGLSEFARTNTLKTLNTLVQGFIDGEITSTTLIKSAFLKHSREGFNIIENLLKTGTDEIKFKATQLLLLLKEDRVVKDRLKYLYENAPDQRTKQLLEKECGFNALKKFGSEGEFLVFVDATTPQIQERLYGARLKKYYENENLKNTEIEGKILTFVMETFKGRETDSQFIYLKEYLRFVDKKILQGLCNVVFEVALYRDRLLGSKWALRLIAMFGSSSLLTKSIKILREWLLDRKTSDTAKYFLDLLAECGREEIIEIIKSLMLCNLDKKQTKFLEEKLSQFSQNINENLEVVKDKITEDFGFNANGEKLIELDNRLVKIQINRDCTLTLTNEKTGKPARIKDDTQYLDCNLKNYLKLLEKEIKKQKKRLYTAFLEFRNYDIETFSTCILSNNLLNYLAQGLIWARYKKGRFTQACTLKNNQLIHLMGNVIYDNFSDYTIALLQPLDCVGNQKILKEKFREEFLFNQIDFPSFKMEELSPNANSIEALSGIFCNAQLFITRLQKLKYKINDLNLKNEYTTLVKENENLNLLTAVEFDKVVLGQEGNISTTVSKIRFYDLNKIIKTGKNYKLDKTEAKVLKAIDEKVLSNEIGLIFMACKSNS